MDLKSRLEDVEIELNIIDENLYEMLEKDWQPHLDGVCEAFSGNYWQMMKLASISISEQNKPSNNSNEVYLVLTNKSNNETLALIQAFHAHPNSHRSCLKIMTLRTTPLLDSRNNFTNIDELNRNLDLGVVLATLVVQGVKAIHTPELESNKFKIYGNKQADNNFFATVIKTLSGTEEFERKVTLEFFHLAAYNRWLEITKRS